MRQADRLRRRGHRSSIRRGSTQPRLIILSLIVFITMAAGCSAGQADIVGAPEDLTDVPEAHTVVQILDGGAAAYPDFVAAVERSGAEFHCMAGGTAQLCLVQDGDVLALVSFDNPNSMVARVTGGDLSGEVRIPLGTDQPVGLQTNVGQVTVDIEQNGETIASMSGPDTVP